MGSFTEIAEGKTVDFADFLTQKPHSRIAADDIHHGSVVSENLPVNDFAIFHFRQPGGGDFPTVGGVEIAIGTICAMGFADDDEFVFPLKSIFRGDGVIRYKLVVFPPGFHHRFASSKPETTGIDENKVIGHQAFQGFEVMAVDSVDIDGYGVLRGQWLYSILRVIANPLYCGLSNLFN